MDTLIFILLIFVWVGVVVNLLIPGEPWDDYLDDLGLDDDDEDYLDDDEGDDDPKYPL